MELSTGRSFIAASSAIGAAPEADAGAAPRPVLNRVFGSPCVVAGAQPAIVERG